MFRISKYLIACFMFLMILYGTSYAEGLSYGTRTGVEYRSDSISYSHSFNEEYGMSLEYSYDAIASSYNSKSVSINRNIDEDRGFSFTYNNYFSNDIYTTSAFGVEYSSLFFVADGEETPVLQPSFNIGINFSNNRYDKAKLNSQAYDAIFGLGSSIYDSWKISASIDQYNYNNESKIKDQAGAVFRPRSKAFSSSSSSPKNIVDGSISYNILEGINIYYDSSTTKDLQEEVTGSNISGLSWTLFDWLSIDVNNEVSGDSTFSSASFNCSL
jgi:hypothetical protein